MSRWSGRFLVLAMLLLSVLPATATEVRAFLDRDSVHLGETVTLNLSVEGAANVGQPDFSALVPDFVLGSSSRNQSIRIDNGVVSKTVLLGVVLTPRRAGTLTIPPITIDGMHSAPLTLEVLPASAQASGTPGDTVFLRTDIEPSQVYVGQQARLRVRLYYAGANLQGQLDQPTVDGAEVLQMGRQTEYASQQGGRDYRVVERNYAIVPERAGRLDILPLSFNGSLVMPSGNFGDFFGRGTAASARSPGLTLEVEAKPAGAPAEPWLPARSLSLDVQGLPADGKAVVGTPITLTIVEKATGLAHDRLPEPSLPDIAGADVYPDKSQGDTDDSGPWLEARRERKFAIVPARPGTLTLPAIAVDWWDVVNDTAGTATWPAHTLEVGGAVTGDGGGMPPAQADGAAPLPTASAASPTASATESEDTAVWRRLTIALAVLWLLTLLAFAFAWRRWRRPAMTAGHRDDGARVMGEGLVRKHFQQAIDAESQARTLLAWAKSERPEIRNLGDLAAQLEAPDQRASVRQLQRARYAVTDTPHDADAVRRAFIRGFAWSPSEVPAMEDFLPPLYPRR